jgi:hypothetical protein
MTIQITSLGNTNTCGHLHVTGVVNGTKPFDLVLLKSDFNLDKDDMDETIVTLLRYIKAKNNYTFAQLKAAVEGSTVTL